MEITSIILLIHDRPGLGDSLISTKWLNRIDSQTIEQYFVDNLVDIFIGFAHGIQEDPMCEDHSLLYNLLVTFRQDIVRILLEFPIQLFDCFRLIAELAIRIIKQLLIDLVLPSVESKSRDSLIKHL